MKLWQEFYCPTSGGGCGGYVLIKLNMALNRRVTIICPKCSHSHQRNIIHGHIVEEGRYGGDAHEEIQPPLSAWSQESLIHPKQKYPKHERVAEEIKLSNAEFQAQQIIRESWISRFAGKLIGE